MISKPMDRLFYDGLNLYKTIWLCETAAFCVKLAPPSCMY